MRTVIVRLRCTSALHGTLIAVLMDAFFHTQFSNSKNSSVIVEKGISSVKLTALRYTHPGIPKTTTDSTWNQKNRSNVTRKHNARSPTLTSTASKPQESTTGKQ